VEAVTVANKKSKELQIDQIRSMINDPLASIKALEEINNTHFKPLIQQLVNGESLSELKELITVFNELAALMKRMGDLSGDVVHYTDAAIIYQYVLTIVEEKLSGENCMKMNTYTHLDELQRHIFLGIGGDLTKIPNVEEEAKSFKTLLLELRENVEEKIKFMNMNTDTTRETIVEDIESQGISSRSNSNASISLGSKICQRIIPDLLLPETKRKAPMMDSETTRHLFEDIAREMRNFLAKIYSDSEEQMFMPPPCSYAVIGLGSMALQQITPYSDLEFAILVENEDFRTNTDPKVRDYFKNLSHLAHFKVIGLRETVIASSKCGVETSHLVHVGVNFDLGGKTPLGRIDNDKPYSLIKTVDWMLEYVYNKEEKASHIDKLLPYILENVCYVYGDENLVIAYRKKVAEFLGSENDSDPTNRLNCEIRAIKLLKEGEIEFDYRVKNLQGKSRETAFKGDLMKLKATLKYNATGHINVKQEIYRLSDRLIYNFGMLYNVTGNSGWDIIDKLCVEQILNEQAAVNLKRALSFATLLRLRTYMHHEAQKEIMSVFPRKADREQKKFELSVDELSKGSELFQYYYIVIPLHKKLQKFCSDCPSPDEKRSFFRESEFYVNSNLHQRVVYFRLSQYINGFAVVFYPIVFLGLIFFFNFLLKELISFSMQNILNDNSNSTF
jgi:hypothetical protein